MNRKAAPRWGGPPRCDPLAPRCDLRQNQLNSGGSADGIDGSGESFGGNESSGESGGFDSSGESAVEINGSAESACIKKVSE